MLRVQVSIKNELDLFDYLEQVLPNVFFPQ